MKIVDWFILFVCNFWIFWGNANPAWGQNQNVQRCASAYDSAQVEMRQGKLISAKQKLVFCSSSECPEVMHADCRNWLSDVESSLPTVVFRVEGSSSNSVVNATVIVDGGMATSVDGRAMYFDPGQHEITFSAPEFRSKVTVLLFTEGEKLRQERIILEPLRPTKLPKPDNQAIDEKVTKSTATRTNWTVPIAIGATLTGVSALSALYFGEKARSEDRALDDCSPNCGRDRIDRIKREYLLANTSLGLMFVGAAATTSFWLFDIVTKDASSVSYVRLDATISKLAFSLNGRF